MGIRTFLKLLAIVFGTMSFIPAAVLIFCNLVFFSADFATYGAITASVFVLWRLGLLGTSWIANWAIVVHALIVVLVVVFVRDLASIDFGWYMKILSNVWSIIVIVICAYRQYQESVSKSHSLE